MVNANSTTAGVFEFIKEIMGTAFTHNSDEHPTSLPPERLSSRSTGAEPTTT